MRQQAVLLLKHARRERLLVVGRQDRHDRLRDDPAGVDLVRDEVHRGAMDAHASRQRLAMRAQTREQRQQRRMDVHQASGISTHEGRRQHAHEARQQDQRRIVPVDLGGERGIERLARRETQCVR